MATLRRKDYSGLPGPPMEGIDTKAFWNGISRGFRHINEHNNVKTMSDHFRSAMDRFTDRIIDLPRWNIPWRVESEDEVLKRIEERLLGVEIEE